MENLPDTIHSEHEDSHIEARTNFILGRLGLSWEELKGKRILDIGAGSAEFGAAARKRGIEVVSLDHSPLDDGRRPYQKKGYVQGSGDHLPFADESFDIIVSHASVPLATDKREMVVRFIDEMRRVLKGGGECRFGPVGMGGGFLQAGDLRESSGDPIVSLNEENEAVSTRKEMEAISLKTTAFLQEIIPDLKNSTDNQLAQRNNFYSFTK